MNTISINVGRGSFGFFAMEEYNNTHVHITAIVNETIIIINFINTKIQLT